MALYDYAMQYVPQNFRWQEEAEDGRLMAVPRGKVPTYAPAQSALIRRRRDTSSVSWISRVVHESR